MQDYQVHSTAVVDDGAEIGAGTRIWHFCHVSEGASIGPDCTLGQNVFVGRRVRIGKGAKIQNNVSLYEGVELEEHVFCGPSMVFTNIKTPRCEYPRNTSSDYIKTIVKRGVSIGANATIVCGITLHPYAFVSAGAVVTKSVPSYALVAGVPGRIVGWMSQCGDRLEFDSSGKAVDTSGAVYQKKGANEVVRLK